MPIALVQANRSAWGVGDQLGDDGCVLPWTTTDALGLNRQVVDAKPQANRARNMLHTEELTRQHVEVTGAYYLPNGSHVDRGLKVP